MKSSTTRLVLSVAGPDSAFCAQYNKARHIKHKELPTDIIVAQIFQFQSITSELESLKPPYTLYTLLEGHALCAHLRVSSHRVFSNSSIDIMAALPYWRLQHAPDDAFSRGIVFMRPSSIFTTSSKFGRLSGFGSQHLVTIFFSVCAHTPQTIRHTSPSSQLKTSCCREG